MAEHKVQENDHQKSREYQPLLLGVCEACILHLESPVGMTRVALPDLMFAGCNGPLLHQEYQEQGGGLPSVIKRW